jgi:hypothetical protein
MDLETIGVAAGGVLAGGLLAGAGGAWWWGHKLKGAAQRIAKLDQARQFADQQGAQVRKQVEQLQKEMAELRMQAGRARPREADAAASVHTRQEVEDMLLSQAPPAKPVEAFPDTQIIPRKR